MAEEKEKPQAETELYGLGESLKLKRKSKRFILIICWFGAQIKLFLFQLYFLLLPLCST